LKSLLVRPCNKGFAADAGAPLKTGVRIQEDIMDAKIMYQTGTHYFEANVNNLSEENEGFLDNYRAKYSDVTEKAWVEDHNRKLCARNGGACDHLNNGEF